MPDPGMTQATPTLLHRDRRVALGCVFFSFDFKLCRGRASASETPSRRRKTRVGLYSFCSLSGGLRPRLRADAPSGLGKGAPATAETRDEMFACFSAGVSALQTASIKRSHGNRRVARPAEKQAHGTPFPPRRGESVFQKRCRDGYARDSFSTDGVRIKKRPKRAASALLLIFASR